MIKPRKSHIKWIVPAVVVLLAAAFSIIWFFGSDTQVCWRKESELADKGPYKDDLKVVEYGMSNYDDAGRRSIGFIVKNSARFAVGQFTVSPSLVDKDGRKILDLPVVDMDGVPPGGRVSGYAEMFKHYKNADRVDDVQLKVSDPNEGCRDDKGKIKDATAKLAGNPKVGKKTEATGTPISFPLKYAGPSRVDYLVKAVFRDPSGQVVGGCLAGNGDGSSVVKAVPLGDPSVCLVPEGAGIDRTEFYLAFQSGWSVSTSDGPSYDVGS